MQSDSQSYITQIKNIKSDNRMRAYAQKIQKKIQNAKWKQNLILTYNYMPLQMAKDKIQNEKQVFQKKMEALWVKMANQTQNQYIENQVQIFRDFSAKLRNKIRDIQQQIQLLTMQMSVVKSAVSDKRNNLKILLKQNIQLTKSIIQHKEQLKRRTATAQKPLFQLTSRKVSENKLTTRKQTLHSQNTDVSSKLITFQSRLFYDPKDLYQQCVKTIVKSLKGMNATEDVQEGIYLQIMNRKISKRPPIFSLKSKACDVLMDRYKDLKSKKPKHSQDFNMSLQTFMGLNWKQIMGILLVKDRNATKLKSILRFSQGV